jgi:beta-glucosidase
VQQELVEVVAATGTPLVVVVLSGRVHTLANITAHANALLQLFPPGEEGGSALADVLFGAVNPSGRLPMSLPRSVGQIPIYSGYRAGGDRPMFFDDYIDCPPTPLFAFGHGLSYTSFAYEQFTVRGTTTNEFIEVSVVVRNTGARAGDEVVQLYLQQRHGRAARPVRELKGFRRVTLEAGETRTVEFVLGPDELRYWHPLERTWVIDAATFDVWVGGDATAAGGTTFETTVA